MNTHDLSSIGPWSSSEVNFCEQEEEDNCKKGKDEPKRVQNIGLIQIRKSQEIVAVLHS
jgi:hypothetical protein